MVSLQHTRKAAAEEPGAGGDSLAMHAQRLASADAGEQLATATWLRKLLSKEKDLLGNAWDTHIDEVLAAQPPVVPRLVVRRGSAPRSSSSRTASSWPRSAAATSAVS